MKRSIKILCGILAVLMMMSLCACGKTDDGTKGDTIITPTEGTVDLQSYYEDYFESPEFAGTSIKMTTPSTTDNMLVEIVSATDGSQKVLMGVGDNIFGLYSKDKENVYVNVVMADETSGETIDAWYRYVPESEETDVFEEYSMDTITEEMDTYFDNIKSVKYEKTENGYDYVTLTVSNLSTNLDGTSDEVIIADEATETSKNTQDITVVIDSNSKKITSISAMIDGQDTTIEFFTADTVEFEIPENAEECSDEEMAMFIMAVMFSMLDTAE